MAAKPDKSGVVSEAEQFAAAVERHVEQDNAMRRQQTAMAANTAVNYITAINSRAEPGGLRFIDGREKAAFYAATAFLTRYWMEWT